MKILELEELLPRLNENAKDVDSWEEEFNRLMRLANINTAASRHSWAMECVEGKLRGTLQDLVTTNEEGEEIYPTVKQMKEALEEALEITPQMKCKFLQKLKIQKGESIKNFNWRYKKLYDNLPEQYKTFITVDDYAESITYRPYARSQVITQQCETLDEAFSEAELAERAENFHVETNVTDTVLTTLYYRRNYNPINIKHPYKLFGKAELRNNKITQHNNFHNSNQTFKINKLNTDSSKLNNHTIVSKKKEFKCFRCNNPGHIVSNCPYSYRDLAEMEEKEQLKENYKKTDPLNSETEEGKLPQ